MPKKKRLQMQKKGKNAEQADFNRLLREVSPPVGDAEFDRFSSLMQQMSDAYKAGDQQRFDELRAQYEGMGGEVVVNPDDPDNTLTFRTRWSSF